MLLAGGVIWFAVSIDIFNRNAKPDEPHNGILAAEGAPSETDLQSNGLGPMIPTEAPQGNAPILTPTEAPQGNVPTPVAVVPVSPTPSPVRSVPADDRFLLLVNKDNTITADFKPGELVDISNRVSSLRAGILLERRVAEQYELMVAAMRAAGVTDMVAASGYREFSHQQDLFRRQVDRYIGRMSRAEAEAEAGKLVAPPGASEHQTGLAVDVTTSGLGFRLTEEFEDTPAFKWLAANAWEYGFILRYPKDKTEITRISYEPWHWRYVGREHAEQISGEGLTLEEYLNKL